MLMVEENPKLTIEREAVQLTRRLYDSGGGSYIPLRNPKSREFARFIGRASAMTSDLGTCVIKFDSKAKTAYMNQNREVVLPTFPLQEGWVENTFHNVFYEDRNTLLVTLYNWFVVHEMSHVAFTPFADIKEFCDHYDIPYNKMTATIVNIVEDIFIEWRASVEKRFYSVLINAGRGIMSSATDIRHTIERYHNEPNLPNTINVLGVFTRHRKGYVRAIGEGELPTQLIEIAYSVRSDEGNDVDFRAERVKEIIELLRDNHDTEEMESQGAGNDDDGGSGNNAVPFDADEYDESVNSGGSSGDKLDKELSDAANEGVAVQIASGEEMHNEDGLDDGESSAYEPGGVGGGDTDYVKEDEEVIAKAFNRNLLRNPYSNPNDDKIVTYKDVAELSPTGSVKMDDRFVRLAQVLMHMRSRKANLSAPKSHGHKIGSTLMHRLLEDGKIFRKKHIETVGRHRPQVILLGDTSGSTTHHGHSGKTLKQNIIEAMMGAFYSLMNSRIPVSAYLHTTGVGSTIAIYKIASFTMPFEPNDKEMKYTPDFIDRFDRALHSASAGNGDGYAIHAVSDLFGSHPGPKIIMHFSDGIPVEHDRNNSNNGEEHTSDIVTMLRLKGIHTISMSLVKDVVENNDRIYGKQFNVRAYEDLNYAVSEVLGQIGNM